MNFVLIPIRMLDALLATDTRWKRFKWRIKHGGLWAAILGIVRGSL